MNFDDDDSTTRILAPTLSVIAAYQYRRDYEAARRH